MTTNQKKKAICKITEGAYIFDEIESYKVTKVYKSGVQYIVEWKNWAGNFHEYKFVTYEELINDDMWRLIIV